MQSKRLRDVVPPTPAGKGLTLALVMLSVTSASYSLVQSMVNPALATLRQSLHTDQLGVSWVLTSYLLASALLTPILGKLGDRFGKRRLLVFALGLLVVGSVVSALAQDLPVMVLGRVLQGAGGAVLPLAFGVIRDLAPAPRVGSAVGIVAAMSSVGAGLGVLVCGPIVEGLGVAWLFWLPAIANGVIAVLLWLIIADRGARATGAVNWLAAALLSAALVCVLLPLSLGADHGWLAPSMLALFAGAVVFGVLWVLVELRSRTPLIDMAVFRMRPVWTANLASLLFGVGLYSTMGFIPTFFQIPRQAGYGFGASVTASGLLFVPITIAMLATGLLAGPLMRLLRPKTVLVIGAIPPVVGFAWLAFSHDHLWEVVVATSIGGLGFGVALSALSAVVVHSVPVTQTGAAAGMNANIRTIGGALGAAVVSTILGSHPGVLGVPAESGYTIAFAALTIAALASLIACLVIPTALSSDDVAPEHETPEQEAAELLDQHNPF
ncbi:MFS transporter [Micromonospora sp. CPCC 205539]|uniref:MFS transporter n=1 Tax=Micromonospora sp. CPCC 205539 TaxID=3122408 RepID=UPI002FF11F89